MKNTVSPEVIKFDLKVKIPPERIEFWEKIMERISQKVQSNELSENEANSQRAKIVAYKECISTTDTLTKLLNRRGFEENIFKLMAIAKRNSLPLSLLFIDADNLKAINNLGHDKGDEFLMIISQAIKEATRTEDLRCRWAGDEFAVSCLGANLEEALVIANRILEKVRTCKVAGNKVTVSIGVGEVDLSKDTDINDRLKVIDEALLKAKETGKDKVLSVKTNV